MILSAALVAGALLVPVSGASGQVNTVRGLMGFSAGGPGAVPLSIQAQALQGYLDSQIRRDLLLKQQALAGTAHLRSKASPYQIHAAGCSGPRSLTLQEKASELKSLDSLVLAWAYSNDQAVFGTPWNNPWNPPIGLPAGYDERQSAALAKQMFLQQLQISKAQKATSTNYSPLKIRPPATAGSYAELATFYYQTALAMTGARQPQQPAAATISTGKISLRPQSSVTTVERLDTTALQTPSKRVVLTPGPAVAATSTKAVKGGLAGSPPLSAQALDWPAQRSLPAAVMQVPPQPQGTQPPLPANYPAPVSGGAVRHTPHGLAVPGTAPTNAEASLGTPTLEQQALPAVRDTNLGPW
jgi:hypothetical protein